ncbi:CKLF-like MARVEL transmembrane domain-containing protein 8 [Sinocyclocheilus grahami]|uniref:CKLF-like MARVEL transmembrane domain-containing protein 8 n=1 Tax=Sinocyclocheilus grahami TaxID=75366 RepID=A0A672KNR9_SINGR|nr:PREDICTED: CKLF-like MARVEL transmembrane domain-containing protein 8 [Sinocyclocheilus grahami]
MAGEALKGTLVLTHIRAHVCRFLLVEQRGWVGTDAHLKKILGLLVWALIASTEYFRFSPFGWVMFVTVFYWLLTLFLLIIKLARGQIRHIPWTTVVLIFNCTAALLYTSAAVVEATLVNRGVKGHHDFNCWAASTFFAFLVSLTYAGSAFFSYKSWHRGDE